MAPSHSEHDSEPEPDSVRARLRGEEYTVDWGTPAAVDPGAGLEVGRGVGHGSILRWLRFRPGPDGVDVLSVRLDEGWRQYRSKWPPDRAPVATARGRMESAAYAELLRGLAVLHAAAVRPARRNSNCCSRTTANFWAHARLASGAEPLFEYDWAGYYGSYHEVEYAKVLAMACLADDAVGPLELRPDALTDADRRWVSGKFARDWPRFAASDSHWWVREQYLITVGVAGDATALPALRDILATKRVYDPHEAAIRAALGERDEDDRCVYYAINAVTRLTGVDVRDEPVEEMDTTVVKPRVLALLERR